MSSTKLDISKLDPRMATKPADANGVAWHLPYEAPMKLCGFNWFEQDGKYERLPIKGRPAQVTQYPGGVKTIKTAEQCGAFGLSRHTAGGQIRFRTDSSRVLVQGTLLATYGMDHMAFTGSAGFDLYLKDPSGWHLYGVTRTDHSVLDFSTTICEGFKREMRDVIIDFPLYNGVDALSVGLDDDAKIEPPTAFYDPRPVVFYGTSITQGGCATRPGMASSNILSRKLNMQVINLGFSGNGKGEPELAAMLADIKDPAMYLIDYCWNVGPDELQATLPNFLDILRKKHPDTPIVLISPTPGRALFPSFAQPYYDFDKKGGIMKREAERRRAGGDAKIYFFDALNDSMGEDYTEGTVDCCHLTDLGFLRFSDAILPLLKHVLGDDDYDDIIEF